MGKSINSWNSYVGHTEHYLKNDCPEKKLFIAVLSQAAHDCFSTHVEKQDKEQARHFFMTDHFHFDLICELADRNPIYVKDKMRKTILLNLTIPDINRLKGYRRDKKNIKEKHLTGNAYYAAKAAKNFYYQGIGSKGGRPRMYNRIEK